MNETNQYLARPSPYLLDPRGAQVLQVDEALRGRQGRLEISRFAWEQWNHATGDRTMGLSPCRSMPPIGELACFEMKMIGKPYAGDCENSLLQPRSFFSVDRRDNFPIGAEVDDILDDSISPLKTPDGSA